MKRLLASVAISALALSGAAFAADAPTAVQKDQAPMASTNSTTAAPAKSADSQAKKPAATVKKDAVKKDKTSMKPVASPHIQQAQAPATATPAKPAVEDSHAKKPAAVKRSDGKTSTGTEQPSGTSSTTT